ncbi:T9SS type A sorting domain-containing protein [Arcticibacterium luteifluviistationis]|uniref:Secretion system C-terminal sorting domain-containing protein n=1 Tax=Arcticibacterium luteifluviistationis TaxID=1784714 RepID=A0A2Z4GBN7_9BACT|nr:T9SS type A sorting domain-containing protein [Arcticibacterium luteifluviistationis]AWV98702.1 hypothetical protein DJ013_11165 [Arcticibacterium luteifluviistationis]
MRNFLIILSALVFTNTQLYSQNISIERPGSPLCNGQKTYIHFDTTGVFDASEEFILFSLNFSGERTEIGRTQLDSIAVTATFSSDIFVQSSVTAISSDTINLSVDSFTGLFMTYAIEPVCEGYSNTLEIYTGLVAGDDITWRKDNQVIANAKENIYLAKESGTYTAKVQRGKCTYEVGGTAKIEIGRIRKANLSSTYAAEVCDGYSVNINGDVPNIDNLSFQWLYEGLPIVGATTKNYAAKETGNYQLSTTQGSCTSVSDNFKVRVGGLRAGSIVTQPIAAENGVLSVCHDLNANLSISNYLQNNDVSVSWLKDGIKVASGKSIFVKTPGEYRYRLEQGSCEVLSMPLKIQNTAKMRAFDLLTFSGSNTCEGQTASLYVKSRNSTISQSSFNFKLYKDNELLNTVPFLLDVLSISESGNYHLEGSFGVETCIVSSDTLTVNISGDTIPFDIYPNISEIKTCSDSTLIANNLNLTGIDGPTVIYTWKKDGQVIGNSNQKALLVKSSGNYSLTVEVDGACTYQSNPLKVSLNSLDAKVITPENGLCAENLNILNVQIGENDVRTQNAYGNLLFSSDISYQWFFDQTALGTKATQTINKSGNYKLSLKHQSCEIETAPVSIQLLQINKRLLPLADTLSICPNGGVTYISAAAIVDSYQWVNDSLNASSNAFEILADKVGSYKVWLEKDGCGTFSDIKTIKATNEIPTATLSGGETIQIGKTSQLEINFTGSAPWTLSTSVGENINVNKSPYFWEVTPLETTVYDLTTVTNPCGLGQTFGNATITVLVLGNEENKMEGLLVYPNPSKDHVRIELNQKPKQQPVVNLFNMKGELLKTGLIADKTLDIDISHLNEGNYLIRVVSENQVMTRKIIKRGF